MDDIVGVNDENLGFRLRMNECGDQTWEESSLRLFGPTGSCLGPYNVTTTDAIDTADPFICDGIYIRSIYIYI